MPPATDWKEVIGDDEVARFERYAAMLGEMQRREPATPIPRALHAKSNLAALAELEVLGDVAADAKLGMFAQPATYRAVVRYSNGSGHRQSDAKPDIRGFAVKVLGVPGKKLIPGLEDATTQDFLAIRTASVPMRNADEFITLVKSARPAALAPIRLIAALGFGRGIGLLKHVLAGFKQPTAPLAATTYYSALPITYGPYAVHYAFVPHDSPSVTTSRGANGLGDELAARLREKPVVYDLKIQFYEDATSTPIEDASVEWKSPFVTVARLTLPVQEPNQKLVDYVDMLSFDPWHARSDLRPLGNIMRARNHAYRVSTQGRKAAPEPTELPSF